MTDRPPFPFDPEFNQLRKTGELLNRLFDRLNDETPPATDREDLREMLARIETMIRESITQIEQMREDVRALRREIGGA